MKTLHFSNNKKTYKTKNYQIKFLNYYHNIKLTKKKNKKLDQIDFKIIQVVNKKFLKIILNIQINFLKIIFKLER